jgi:hypothetical protein
MSHGRRPTLYCAEAKRTVIMPRKYLKASTRSNAMKMDPRWSRTIYEITKVRGTTGIPEYRVRPHHTTTFDSLRRDRHSLQAKQTKQVTPPLPPCRVSQPTEWAHHGGRRPTRGRRRGGGWVGAPKHPYQVGLIYVRRRLEPWSREASH